MKSIAVIGLGQFGFQIAVNLAQKGVEVLGIDKEVEIISEIKDLISKSVIVDSTDEKALRSINIDSVDKAVIAIGTNVQSSLLTAALLQRMNVSPIYVRAINPLQESILKSMGVEHILNIEEDMGTQLANTILSEGVGRYIEISDRHSLIETFVPKRIVGKNLKEIEVRAKFGINIVGIKNRIPEINDEGEVLYTTKMTDVPDPDYNLKKDDILVIVGTDDNLNKFLDLGRGDV